MVKLNSAIYEKSGLVYSKLKFGKKANIFYFGTPKLKYFAVDRFAYRSVHTRSPSLEQE